MSIKKLSVITIVLAFLVIASAARCTNVPTPTVSPLQPTTSAPADPIQLPPLTADQLGLIVGTALTLAFSYIPGLEGRYEKLGRRPGDTDEENDKRNSAYKRMIMGILVVGFGVAIFGLSCTDALAWVECSKAGGFAVLTVVFNVLISNQSVYRLTKRG